MVFWKWHWSLSVLLLVLFAAQTNQLFHQLGKSVYVQCRVPDMMMERGVSSLYQVVTEDDGTM